jgi:hypothetical protein
METQRTNNQSLDTKQFQELIGREITLRVGEDAKVGKMKPTPFPNVDGWNFVFRDNENTIRELFHIFPCDVAVKDWERPSCHGLSKILDTNYTLLCASAGIGFSYNHKSCPITGRRFAELDNYLKTGMPDLKAVA